MSLIKKMVGASVVALALASSSQAITITTGGLITPYYLSVADDPTYNGLFTLAGYNPALQQIDSAVASFAFSDGSSADSAQEVVDVTLGGLTLINDQEVDGTHQNVPTSYAWYSASLTEPMMVDLELDGSIAYVVTLLNLANNTDNTWLKGAKITVEVSNKPRYGVPDGGSTLAMLGLALTGMACLRRKLS